MSAPTSCADIASASRPLHPAAPGERVGTDAAAKAPVQAVRRKSFALVLGGGGARGLAHIPVLEALDEIGLRPSVIAGSSIGAAIGAAYAAGMSGRDIRRHAIRLLHDRPEILRRLMRARAVSLREVFSAGFGNPMVMNAEKLTAALLPQAMPRSFAQLGIPLIVMTTDLYARAERAFEEGPLNPALAASMAIPGLVRPVEIDGRVLIDGAAVNPLPFACVRERADIVLAVDTSVGPSEPRGIPDPWDALFAAIQIMGHTIVNEKLKVGPPDVLVRPNVGSFRLLDFFKVSAILRAADPVKAHVQQKITELIEAR
ncbi:MAG TPA: patatin-like phospholipase family protein [Xanthobacteraceae bacterium]|nr:patatin-like phospholipase family protein [Xanthobacteraceae bacterium]